MWEDKKVGRQKSGSRAAEASASLFCSSNIMSYGVYITEQTTAKSYLFVLYNKKKTPELKQVNSLLFIHPNILKFEKVEILQISRVT
jgi:hypothetical protein